MCTRSLQALVVGGVLLCASHAFVATPPSTITAAASGAAARRPVVTPLHAVPALLRQAKRAELREYVNGGVPPEVLQVYEHMKKTQQQQQQSSSSSSSSPQERDATADDEQARAKGPLQEALTRRAGTITVIAEYARQPTANSAYLEELDATVLSPLFREYGASAVAVTSPQGPQGRSDEFYADLDTFVEEQRRASNEVPGPIAIINNDVIVDALQIARSKVAKVGAVTVSVDLCDSDELLRELLDAASTLELECIVKVANSDQAATALAAGATILAITAATVEDKVAAVVDIPEDVCKIAVLRSYNNKQFQEIEEAWALRDKGFQAVWVGDALYKSNSETEHPGAVIQSMKSKSSLKWASPVARAGRGEGAREYLGDILM